MIEEGTARQFYKRLNHQDYGLTEVVALEKDTGGIVATGFFGNEDDFFFACRGYNGRCNVYAGRNPRPFDTTGVKNFMNIIQKKRAKDKDIKYLTAVSLDIDPVRKKGIPSTKEQRQAAIGFALDLQWDLGGDVDDSGNGAYLWIPFITPIEISADNSSITKKKCEIWQALLKEKYKPEEYGLRIDGCFDFSRLKRVIGTLNHKAQRFSRFVKRSEPDNKVRDEVLSMEVNDGPYRKLRSISLSPFSPTSILPQRFKRLLRWDNAVRKLWQNPDPLNDTSRHDWLLGLCCMEAGITSPDELAAVLMNNPHGKYRRDGRKEYLEVTVGKMVEGRGSDVLRN